MTPTPINDLLDAVVGGEAHAAPNGHPPAGGEWDPYRALSTRQRRRLAGARRIRRNALPPDVLADLITARHPALDGADPLDWYFRTALRAIDEARHAANRDRHQRLATSAGHRTYYAYRDQLAYDHGHTSLWHYRKTMGWK